MALRSLGVRDIFVHAFLDGRDTPPNSASGYLRRLVDFTQQQQAGKIATVNVYSLGASSFTKDNFKLNVMHKNDSTGV